jgi:hypothetical protein
MRLFATLRKPIPFRHCHPERSEGSAFCGGLQILASLGMTKPAVSDLIIDILNNPLQRSRQRFAPARPLQLTHPFR